MPAFQYIYCMTKISLNINSVHPSGVVVFHKVMYACSLGAAWVQWCWRITEEDVYQGVQRTTRGPESGPPPSGPRNLRGLLTQYTLMSTLNK